MSLKGRPNRAAPLLYQYKVFTHGGSHWSDNYRLEWWANARQPVVYRDQVYHGYRLIRRLGCWSWLTKDPQTNAFSTVKFLSRPRTQELEISQLIRDQAKSPFVCKIHDHFQIPHHLQHLDEFKDVDFDAIVYPLMGSDVRRVLMGQEIYEGDPDLDDEYERKERIARQVVRAVAELHRIGVVHGDIHTGNVGLPPPSESFMEDYLAKTPMEHEVKREDGQPTPLNLPHRVTEPEYIGYGPEDWCMLFDFGFSFQPTPGALYDSSHFTEAMPLPPEIVKQGDQTSLPFKVDSWQLGILLYYLLTDRPRPFDMGLSEGESLEHYQEITERLSRGTDRFFKKVPKSLHPRYIPAITALWAEDPAKRLSVTELSQNKEFMLDI